MGSYGVLELIPGVPTVLGGLVGPGQGRSIPGMVSGTYVSNIPRLVSDGRSNAHWTALTWRRNKRRCITMYHQTLFYKNDMVGTRRYFPSHQDVIQCRSKPVLSATCCLRIQCVSHLHIAPSKPMTVMQCVIIGQAYSILVSRACICNRVSPRSSSP
jgi:hypothetical protein